MADNENNQNSKTGTARPQPEVAAAATVTPVVSYVVTTFRNVEDARKAYKALKEEKREGSLEIIDAAYVEKTDSSRIKVHDHGDWAIGGGVLAGGVTGAIIGIIAGTVLLPAVIGALVGGAITGIYESDTKFSDRDLRRLGETLPVGSSVLVAIVEDDFVEDVAVAMDRQGGKKTHTAPIPKSTTESLMASSAKK